MITYLLLYLFLFYLCFNTITIINNTSVNMGKQQKKYLRAQKAVESIESKYLDLGDSNSTTNNIIPSERIYYVMYLLKNINHWNNLKMIIYCI